MTTGAFPIGSSDHTPPKVATTGAAICPEQSAIGQSMIVLENPTRWRRLVHEYSTFRELPNGMTPQSRGQRFNSLIADLFTVFGIAAKANQNSVGELDVIFTHGGRRFILEAKWEQKKTATGPIAKLQRRVDQRMAGVTGVFLSMKGYSEHALAEIDKGRRLDIILLDEDHWEAMLSGFVPPAEMLDLATDAASFNGSAYTPLHVLLNPNLTAPEVTFGTPAETASTPFRSIADHIQAEFALSDIEARQPALASNGKGKLLITTDDGVLSVDLTKRSAHWAIPVSGCHSSIPLPDGSILIQRAY
jgi:Holliday junction resolvase-like predicted endonuclease